MAHDVFISYSNKDKTVADAVCGTLETQKIRCWIAPRDVPAGKPFAASLVSAIRESSVFVLVLSEDSNHSTHVLREVSEAVDSGIPIIPFRISDTELSEEMHYYIKSLHWLDALNPPMERHLKRLAESVRALLSIDDVKPAETPLIVEEPSKIHRKPLPIWAMVTIAVASIIILSGLFSQLIPRRGASSPETQVIQHATITFLDTPTMGETHSSETLLAESLSTVQDSSPTSTNLFENTIQTEELEYFVDELGVPMVLIPAGSFLMGSEWGDDDEAPVHEVTVDAFYIDVYEVTNELFVRFLEEMGNREEGGTTWLDAGSEYGKIFQSSSGWLIERNYENHPVVMISWGGARAFCEWRGGRLPTEAEWEKAARGGLEGALYPWGDELPITTFGAENGAQFGDYGVTTVQVGKYTPNGYGLHNMAGNVTEWVSDYYMDDYYSNSPTDNPQGPESGTYYVVRGGSWAFEAYKLRVSYRHWGGAEMKFSNYGFRCARTP